jgi:hypothetical protein
MTKRKKRMKDKQRSINITKKSHWETKAYIIPDKNTGDTGHNTINGNIQLYPSVYH